MKILKHQILIDGYIFTVVPFRHRTQGSIYIMVTYMRKNNQLPVKDILGKNLTDIVDSRDKIILLECIYFITEIAKEIFPSNSMTLVDLVEVYNERRLLILSEIQSRAFEAAEKIRNNFWNQYYTYYANKLQ